MARGRTLAFGLALGGAGLFGLPTAAQIDGPEPDIPFLVTNHSGSGQCIRCVGPRFRDSLPQQIPPLPEAQTIFTARVTDFSPFGGWTCRLTEFDADAEECTSRPIAAADFCLVENPGPASVDLTVSADGSLSANQPRHCNTDPGNVAFLGDRKRSFDPDEHTYVFTAAAGNAVILTLEPEARRPGRGSHAILSVRRRGEAAGTLFGKVVRGPLPLRLEAAVPETGDYEISVAQPLAPPRARFRGFYRLSLRSNILVPRVSASQDEIGLAAAGTPPSPLPEDAGCYVIDTMSAALRGDLEVHNDTGLFFDLTISRGSNEVLGRTPLAPDSTFFFHPGSGVESVEPGVVPPFIPFIVDLEGYDDGVFVGSTKLALSSIRNRVMFIEVREC